MNINMHVVDMFEVFTYRSALPGPYFQLIYIQIGRRFF